MKQYLEFLQEKSAKRNVCPPAWPVRSTVRGITREGKSRGQKNNNQSWQEKHEVMIHARWANAEFKMRQTVGYRQHRQSENSWKKVNCEKTNKIRTTCSDALMFHVLRTLFRTKLRIWVTPSTRTPTRLQCRWAVLPWLFRERKGRRKNWIGTRSVFIPWGWGLSPA